MSTTPFGDLRNGALGREFGDDRMDQIRELLYGEFKRDNDARIALLEARVRELEAGLHRKLDAITDRLERLGTEIKDDRAATFNELAASVTELGDRVRRISRG